MTNYKSYELLAHYNEFGAKNSSIVDEILAHGDLDFQIPSSVPYKGTTLKGYTALHIALRKEDYEIFQVLVNSGADFTIKNAEGSTVLHQAIENIRGMTKYRNFIDSVLSAHVNYNVSKNPHHNNGVSHFHVACMMNRVDAVELFSNNGVSLDEAVNSGTFAGYTALHFAAQYCCLQAAKVLLDRGASVSLKDDRGLTPLHLLISRKMEILDWKNVGNRAPWGKFKVEIETNARIIDLILGKRDVESDDALDELKLSYFHVACTFQDTSRVAKLLVENSIDLEHRVAANSLLWPGYTALHFAAHCNPETVVLLLENGADFLAKDVSGATPLDLCLQRYEVEHLHRFMNLEPALQNILFSDGTTRLTDAILAMKNEKTLSDFIDKIADINSALESPVWSGYALLHLATILPERNKPIAMLGEFIHAGRTDELENLYNCSEESEALYLNRIKMCLNRGANFDIRDAHDSTPLHLAFRLRKGSAVDCLLANHESLGNAVDRDNLSHLYIACAAGNETAVESLLSKSIDHVNRAVTSKFKYLITFVDERPVDFGISAGATPLHVAVSTGNEKVVELLLDHEADRYARDANGLTPIHYVFMRGLRAKKNRQIYRELASTLLLSDDLRECETSFGLTHLHTASFANDVTDIEKLLTSGANIEASISAENSLDEELKVLKIVDGFTSLHLASKHICEEAAVALIRRGADFLAVPPKIGFELHQKHSDFLAATLMNEVMSRETMKRDFGLTQLHAACATLDVDRTRELLKRGANPNARVHQNSPLWAGNAPLHFVVIRRDDYPMDSILSILASLWKYRVDVTVENSNNETALLNAMFRGFENRAFKFPMSLIDNHRNFKVNPVNNEGWSHFHVACFWNKSAMVKKFVKCGVNVNQPIDYLSHFYAGFSPIHMTAYRKCNETLEFLLKHGADVHVRNISCRTPFHEAVNFKYYEHSNMPFPVHLGQTPVMSLLKAGAEQTSLTPLGESSFEIFLKSSHRFTSKYVGIDYDRGSINLSNPLTGEGYIAMAVSQETDVDKLPENLLYQTLIKTPKKHVPDEQGRTPIHNIVSIWSTSTTIEVYINVIEQLMDLNFDIDQQDSKGRTALHWATKFRNWTAIGALLTLGSDINITDINNETPLSYIWKFYESINSAFDKTKELDRLVLETILRHMCKMRHVRIRISRINDNIVTLFQKSLPLHFSKTKQLDDEVKKLKTTSVDSFQTTLWDILPETCVIPSYPNMSPWKRLAIRNFFKNNKALLREEFSQFAGLLTLQHRKALNRTGLLIPAKNCFIRLIDYKLPNLCCDFVLMYLDHADLESLTKLEASSLRKGAPSTVNGNWTCRNFFELDDYEESDNFEIIMNFLFPFISKVSTIKIKFFMVELYIIWLWARFNIVLSIFNWVLNI